MPEPFRVICAVVLASLSTSTITSPVFGSTKLDTALTRPPNAETSSLRTSASGKIFIDYKDTETLKKMISNNGKILSRKRTGANAMEQRMLAKAIKRSRYMALLPYVSPAM